MNEHSTQPLSEDEIDTLELFLQTLEGEEAILGISELDGFLTAVASSPNVIETAEWLDAVWGGPDDAPIWDTTDEAEKIIGLIIRHMQSIDATLLEDPASFDPIFMEDEFEGEAVLNVDAWCQGYLKGMQLDAEGWRDIEEDAEELLAPILIFGLEDGLDGLVNAEDEEIEAIQRQVAPAARRLHAYWIERGDEPDFE